VFKYQN